MSYDEPEGFRCCDIVYKATKAQANEVWMELLATTEWVEFDRLENVARYVELKPDPNAYQLCEKLARMRVRVNEIVNEIVQRKGLA